MTPPTPALRASSMPKSAIREIMALAAGRSGMIHLEVGEPEFSTPGHIIEGALQAAREGWTKYTPNAGIPSLRALIAERYAKSRNIQITPDQVTVTVGAIGALFTAVMVVADPGDEVLIPDPGWPNYESIVHLAAAKPVRYLQRGENGFLPRPEDLKRLITPATRAILVNSPGNPTGAVFPGELVQAIADLAREHGIFVISDEIYEDIVFEDGHVSFSGRGIDDRTLIVSGVSKTYAMTGWRLGYLIAPPELGSICAALQEPIISSAPTVSQKASEIALLGPQACVVEFRSIFLPPTRYFRGGIQGERSAAQRSRRCFLWVDRYRAKGDGFAGFREIVPAGKKRGGGARGNLRPFVRPLCPCRIHHWG